MGAESIDIAFQNSLSERPFAISALTRLRSVSTFSARFPLTQNPTERIAMQISFESLACT